MTSWTGTAHLLADDLREPGFAAAAVTASAWRAGVHPEATHGLVGAAMALTQGEAMSGLFAEVPPMPDAPALLEQAAELEGRVAELSGHRDRMAQACRDELEAAAKAWERARKEAESAEDAKVRDAAGQRMTAAARVIADCEAALEVLGTSEAQLAYALRCLRLVPDDFAGHYEIPYEHQRRRGPLPRNGDFLTGAPAEAA